MIRTCDKAGKLEVALRLLAEMHTAGVEGLEETYGLLINRLGAQRDWDRCIDIFLSLQMVGVEVTHEVFAHNYSFIPKLLRIFINNVA